MNRKRNSILLSVIFFLLHQPYLIQAASGPPDASLDIPLAGTVEVPLSNGKVDTVPISGNFHVVSHFSDHSSEIEYWLTGSLVNVSGTGDYTGLLYEAAHSWLEVITRPQIREKQVDIFARTYLLTTVPTLMFPPNSCPAGGICTIPVNLYFTTSFDSTGMMTAITISQVSIPSDE